MQAPWMLRAKNNDVFNENKRTAKKQPRWLLSITEAEFWVWTAVAESFRCNQSGINLCFRMWEGEGLQRSGATTFIISRTESRRLEKVNRGDISAGEVKSPDSQVSGFRF